jgi:hypothetical protein
VPNADRMELVSPLVRTREYREVLHEANNLFEVMRLIRVQKKTGSLTINFNQGTPGGSLKWTELAGKKE